MRSASLRPAPSRSRSPSRWRVPESSPDARPATDLRRALWRASASPRCGGAGLPAPLPECRTGTDGSRLQSRQLPCPPLGRRVDPLIVEAVALRRRAANFVEAVAPRRRGERSRTTLSESPLRVNAVRPSVGTRGLGGGQQLLPRRELHARALLAAATLELLGVD